MKNKEVMQVKYISSALIKDSDLHWDREIPEEDVKDLSQSIRDYGLVHPITVRKNKKIYDLIAGKNRFLAMKKLGVTEIPCIVKDISDTHARILSIEENLKRFNAKDAANKEAIRTRVSLQKELLEEKGEPEEVTEKKAIETVAKKTGLGKQTVKNIVDQANLVKSAKKALEDGKITEAQANILAKLKPKQQYEELPRMLEEKQEETLSRKKVEKLKGSSTRGTAGAKTAIKAFDKILTLSKELGALAKQFRNELTDEIGSAIVEMNKDYLKDCHVVTGQLIEDIDSIKDWKDGTD